jgi:CHAD domain-containing protein
MTYRFKLREPIARGVSRIGLDQIDLAEARLASQDDISTAIHDVRRSLKRLRALLRLIRPALPDATYRREIRAIAAIGRQFAQARDRAVMQQTLSKLESRFGRLPTSIGPRLGKLPAKSGPEGLRPSGKEKRNALAALRKARAFFARIERERIGLDHINEGLERAYRQARRAFRDCYLEPTDEAFHAWRKAVQQHWRHMQLLCRAWPDVLEGRASEAKELSRLLGEDHDLAVLLDAANSRKELELSPDAHAELVRLCRVCQSELRDLARPRGARLFAEPAGDLTARLAVYWSAAEHLSALNPPAKPDRPARADQTPRASKRKGGGSRQAASGALRARTRGSGR